MDDCSHPNLVEVPNTQRFYPWCIYCPDCGAGDDALNKLRAMGEEAWTHVPKSGPWVQRITA